MILKRSLKNNRTLIIFYFLIAYVILQFLWWGFHIIDLSEQIGANDGDLRNTISMIVGEAAVFFLSYLLVLSTLYDPTLKKWIWPKKRKTLHYQSPMN